MIKVATVGVHDHMENMTGSEEILRNLMSKAAPTAMLSTSTVKIAALLVSASFVNIPKTLSLAEEPARRSYLERQAVGRVATPDLEGGQVAVSPSYVTFTLHATTVAYYGVKEMYV